MPNARREISLGFDHEAICEGQHICLIYKDDESRQSMLAKFLGSGLQDKEKVISLVDTQTPEQFIALMLSYGLDLRDLGEQLILEQAAPVYCPDGKFIPERMIEVLEAIYTAAKKEGAIGIRGTGEMTWSLKDGCTSMHDLIEYEARLNMMITKSPMTVCCQYDARAFDGATLMDVMTVHPMMIVGGQLMNNPMYVDPHTFLARRAQSRPDTST